MIIGVFGYYFLQVIEDDGKWFGVVVIKVELFVLEQEWLSSLDVVLVSDDYDVVFLVNWDSWCYWLLCLLCVGECCEMFDVCQYVDCVLQFLCVCIEDVLFDGGCMVWLLDFVLLQLMLW